MVVGAMVVRGVTVGVLVIVVMMVVGTTADCAHG
jgi:hypothetical protein